MLILAPNSSPRGTKHLYKAMRVEIGSLSKLVSVTIVANRMLELAVRRIWCQGLACCSGVANGVFELAV